ncbi:hypothetical protein GCM10010261_33900 [Streptomyces pilosus]|uniref:Secreted protein n=2 Tax=Streptomyces pilosus TaxID=28893 RepID=A0A918BPL5_9ACTN|nr:hypothetical protein GCM10010280_34200 [Streptomyces pilosus]GGV52915.1 hypothetical protein GCM10010261_33900 [Streptomyces pilosus]
METAADLAASRGALGIGLGAAALVVVALLIGMFAFGSRRTRNGSRRPRPEEQPRMPAGGPVREVREQREPDEVPRSDERMTPHELNGHGNAGSRTGAAQERPRWDEGSSGSFGSGGPGSH